MLQEYEKNQLDRKEQQKVCCDENTPCVHDDDSNNNNNKVVSSTLTTSTTTDTLAAVGNKQQQVQNQEDYSHKGENRHSKNTEDEELGNENLKANLKVQIKEELEKQEREQQILLKENKQNIIDFIIGNKDSIRVKDLQISEPFYKCYREKGNCIICNSLSNIICTNCCNNHKEIWLCTNHWQQHKIEKHE